MKDMKKEKPHCLRCKNFIVKDENKPTQEYICSLFNHVISSDDVFKKVDCNSYQSRPYTCASCGAEIIGGKKVSNPLRYRSGKNKGKTKPCCDNPDWRVCPNRDCEADVAIICKNCGYYWGDITW